MPWARSARSRSWSSSKATEPRWYSQLSVSTASRCVGEEEVDEVAVDAVVDERPRQPVVVAEGEEEQLEVGARALDRAEVRDAVPGELRLAQRAAEEVGLDSPRMSSIVRAGVVTAMPWRRVMSRRRERAGAVDVEPGPWLPTNSGSDGDVDRPWDRPQELPERRGTRMAQHRPVPRREHRRQPSSPPREAPMPHRVDAAVQPMQPPRLHPPRRLPFLSIPAARKLLHGHDSVLPPRDRRDPTRRLWSVPRRIATSKAPRPSVSPPAPGRSCALDSVRWVWMIDGLEAGAGEGDAGAAGEVDLEVAAPGAVAGMGAAGRCCSA